MNNKLKIQMLGYKVPLKDRNDKLFYYDLRDSEIDDGFIIERNVVVNNIGSVIANQDILKGKEYITNEELEMLEYIETEEFVI